jgi:predicted acyl esterase
MSRLLGLQLAASEPRALRSVESAMRAAKGSVRDAAAALGVHEGSLSRWLRLPQLVKAAALRQGREAVGARSKTKATRTAKAKTTRSRKDPRE